MKKLLSLSGLSLLALAASAMPAWAAANAVLQPVKRDLVTVIDNAISVVMGIAAAIAVAYLVYGGFVYLTGGAKGADAGKAIIANALIGLAIIALSYAIVNFAVTVISGG